MDRVELAFAGIVAQAEAIRAGRTSSGELVDLYLERIEQINPQINAFVAVYADQARAAAAEADRRVAAGEEAPLLGVPIALKDEVDVAGQISGHGTRGWDQPAAEDAAQWRRLREAGAILLGRTTLPELAICGFTETDGYGITRNPWDSSRSPGGSSGGSAAAVAAGLVGAASASDGAGSIRIPAANCGLFGLKPQRGRVSLAPLPNHWTGLSVAGCVARRVVDTALWMDIVSGAEPGDADVAKPMTCSFSEAASADPGPLRLAWSVKGVRAMAPPIISDEVVAAVNRVVFEFDQLGHTVTESNPAWGQIGNNLAPRYLRGIADDFKAVPFPGRLESRTHGFARLGRAIPDSLIRRCLREEAVDQARVFAIFDQFDALIMPTTGEPPIEVGRWAGAGAIRTVLGMSRTYPFAAPWNHLGNPAASVPAGLTADGLPLGAQIVVPPGREDVALMLAAQLEARTEWHSQRPEIASQR